MAMLGSGCNSCCGDGDGKRCANCATGTDLPDAVTVKFSGPQGAKQQGPPLLQLAFASCFGSGAAGDALAPGGVPGVNIGPISGVKLNEPGSGYAKLGRVAPTLTVTNSSVVPAEVEISVVEDKDDCDLPYWRIASLSIKSGGAGYSQEPLEVTIGAGGVAETAAVATLVAENGEPSLEADATPGEGATFSVQVSENDPKGTWGVTKVTFTGNTSGYEDESVLLFSGEGVIEQAAAVARIITVRSEPTLELYVESAEGSGAVLSGTIVQNNTEGTPATWGFESISIDDGGSGYGNGDPVRVTIIDGQLAVSGAAWIEGNNPVRVLTALVVGTDENGAITEIVLFHGGNYYKPNPTGAIDYVWIETRVVDYASSDLRGEYYVGGVLTGITIANGGRYYEEDDSLTPLVADVSVSVRQLYPGGGGSGAEITATVNTNTASPNFGRIESLSVVDGGAGYLAWAWVYSCDCDWTYDADDEELHDREIVCWRVFDFCQIPFAGVGPDTGCRYVGWQCWPEPNAPGGDGDCLVRVEVSNAFRTEEILLTAPAGIPGIDGGPINGVGGTGQSSKLLGWAFPGRALVAPNYLIPSRPDGEKVQITCTMQQLFHASALPYWSVSSVSVPPGVTDLIDGEAVELYSEAFDSLEGEEYERPFPRRASGVAVVDDDGELIGVQISDGGAFYVIDEAADGIEPPITVGVVQLPPSNGEGADIKTEVVTDPNNLLFGKLTLSILNGGSGYLGAVQPGGLPVVVQYNGPATPPTVTVTGPGASFQCYQALTTDELPTCNNFSFTATFEDQEAVVTPGEKEGPLFNGSNKCCGRCYVDCPERPTQVSVALSREAASGHVLREEDNAVSPNYNLGIFDDPGVQEYGFVECDAHELELVFDLLDLIEDRDLCSLTICMPFSGLGGGGGGLLGCPGPFEGGAVSMIECLQQEERDEFLRPDFLDAVYDTDEVFGLVIPKEATHAYASLRIIGPSQSPTASVFFQSAWWTSPPVTCTEFNPYGRPVSLKQKTYTLRAGEACSEFPNSFDLVETESGTAQEGTYEFGYGGITVGVHRRICHHYDMQVEFS
jgi:hypothetical protein